MKKSIFEVKSISNRPEKPQNKEYLLNKHLLLRIE
jgi:hypothetical protein